MKHNTMKTRSWAIEVAWLVLPKGQNYMGSLCKYTAKKNRVFLITVLFHLNALQGVFIFVTKHAHTVTRMA